MENTNYRIILSCDHLMIEEGFKKFCLQNPHFSVKQTYASINHIQKQDFDPLVGLVLICHECNRKELYDPDLLFPFVHLCFPNSKLVIINSEFKSDEMIGYITLGVKGFLPKKFSAENMRKAFQAILEGEIWVSRKLTDDLLNKLIQESASLKYIKPDNIFRLSKREREVIEAMACGLSNFEIGEKLFISEKTVKAHIHHIFEKMEVKNRTQAVLKAKKNRLV